MNLQISSYFKGDRKYFAIVFFILLIIFLIGITTPKLIDSKKSNWQVELSDQILKIEEGVKSSLYEKEIKLLKSKELIKEELHHVLNTSTYEYGDLISLVNDERYAEYSVEIVAPNGKIIAWNNKIAIKQEKIFPFVYPVNQAHFFNTALVTYLTVIDTLKVDHDLFYFIVSLPVEKHYELQNKYYKNISFTDELSARFNTLFNVYYDPYTQPSKDGRIHSILLLNSEKSKIGLVSFFKPSINFEISEIEETATRTQIILLIAVLIFLTIGLRSDFVTIKWKSVRLLILIFYFSVIRIVLFWSNFPARFLEGPLVDPSHFSSTFAWGIVKSPVEFFVTNFFLLIIAFKFFKYIFSYFNEKNSSRFIILKFLLTPLLSVLMFFTLRGLAASVKSVVFDSTIRYFKDPDLIPGLPALLMNLNILVLGLASVLVITAFLLLTGKFLKLLSSDKSWYYFLAFFILVQALCFIFFQLQREPLITPLMSFIFFTLIFLIIYNLVFKNKVISVNIIYSSLAASVIVISMLNYFNLELEKKSLKVIAYEVNRTNKELLSYLLDETLRNALQDNGLVNSFYKLDANYNSEAFLVWSRSSLQRESLNSNITILDRNFNVLGKFTVGFDEPINYKSLFMKSSGSEKFLEELESSTESEVKFAGIVPVKRDSIIAGYITAAVIFNIDNLGAEEFPDFLESNKAALGSVVDLNLVKIFEISDGNIDRVRGDIFPSKEHKEQILNVKLSPDNDSWITLSFNKEDYITYVLVTNRNGVPKTTAVAIKEKEITWSLYNFFKIFIIHSAYILLLIIIFLSFRIIKIKYSFRTKLLVSFLLISIIPIVALAVYNREVVKKRTREAVFDELSKRSEYLENHIKAQKLKHPERELFTAFENAGKELNISFTIYDTADEIFSSGSEYYENGLLPKKLNSDAHYNLNYLSYREYLTSEQIDNYNYDAYYRKINIDDKTYIICVNDAFNKIKIYYSPVDADVFLFGVYSFAVIIITLLSTLFANQISLPIQKLTRATNAVARGDLNVKLQNKEKGELKELFDGFNSMTNELQKNQQEIAELERENAWKEMAKQVAHEIKNPLTPMKLSVQQLIASFNDRRADFEETFKKLSQAILNQIENLNLIASEFSSFAKMPSLKVEPFDLIREINDTINIFADDEIEIRFECTENNVMIESDKSQIRRMIINLVRNSIQAHADLVKVNLDVKDNFAEIEISDNGKGISPENQRKIFESNFTTKEKGLGIGLKLIKRFLENTNSEINLVSSSSEGTTFRIRIPLKKIN